jgi:tripartite-type tricarboxylate transporter receptor subunit TctC
MGRALPARRGTDVVARTLAEAMGKKLGQTWSSTTAGAATKIGAEYVARAKPDGYVLLSADTATLRRQSAPVPKLGYDPEKDFAPLGLTVRFPLILVVNPSSR